MNGVAGWSTRDVVLFCSAAAGAASFVWGVAAGLSRTDYNFNGEIARIDAIQKQNTERIQKIETTVQGLVVTGVRHEGLERAMEDMRRRQDELGEQLRLHDRRPYPPLGKRTEFPKVWHPDNG